MTTNHSSAYLSGLVQELRKLPQETEWVEFKENPAKPDDIGAYISALANSAALEGKVSGYVIWGIRDADHAMVGTTFNPDKTRIGNEKLGSWLLRLLEPKIDFHFHSVQIGTKSFVVLEIESAKHRPVRFSGTEHIRVDSYTKPLWGAPEKERALWRTFDQVPFEDGIAAEHLGNEDVIRLLDYQSYFDLLKSPTPGNHDGILSALSKDGLVVPCEAGGWNVTNMGAILLANNLSVFPRLSRKAVRIIRYRGSSRISAIGEKESMRGYASDFENLIKELIEILPSNEIIKQALRQIVPVFPPLAVRELVANALIHQDFFVTGAGPMVEIFDERIEITNPGEPLVSTERFLDAAPKSRNEKLAALMRRFGICEERGSGIQKVVFEVELHQLPAPLFEAPEHSIRAVLFAHKPLTKMSKEERVRACYLHACLCYVSGYTMNNTSLRKRFGLADNSAARASQLLKEAVDSKVIIVRDPQTSNRYRTYLPCWAC